MKDNRFLLLLTLLLMFASSAVAQETAKDLPQKREMRSAWVATVWQLDWPQTIISATGNESQISSQKKQMTTLLDSLALNNFNAINFQVRSRCDAMYKSSYEPWSTDLVKTRGMDPGWDPLEWTIQECHARGMECHAWINPYRYESQVGQWTGTPQAYRDSHPEWLLDVGGASILNPGLPEVTQRICDVIKEIVTNYDVDGVLFDDYFYLSGTTESHDGTQYNKYKSSGGTLSIGDWRRENVNNMIASVYRTIKNAKPWVRFGVSPAGIACTSTTVANKYGITRCPTGSDWQYNDIYSDPIAWISAQTIDFISPQIYWTIGYSTNYDSATKWWSMVANKWNRHVYVSHDIATLTASSKVHGMSGVEENVAESVKRYASGPNNTSYSEYANEVRLNREYNYDDAPGSIFYSAKYLYRNSPKFAHYLANTVFNTKALIPPLTWQTTHAVGLVEDLSRNGSTLTWKAMENMRYTVYAFPENIATENFLKEGEYLLGITYKPEFTIPSKALSGMKYAVCAYDRYGNEYTPTILGVPAEQLDATTLKSPVKGETVEVPFTFEWQAVNGASEYIVEIYSDNTLAKRIDQRSTTSTSISSESFITLPVGTILYWRVRSCGAGKADGVSALESFIAKNLIITSPENFSENVSLTPTFEYSSPDRDVVLEIATSELFDERNIVLATDGKNGKITVPKFYLSAGTIYYARMRYERMGIEMVTPVVQFTTKEMAPQVPSLAVPVNGGTLYSDQYFTLTPIEGASSLRLEVSDTDVFSSRTSYVANISTLTMQDTKEASAVKVNGKTLVDGATYYVRARSTYHTLPDGSVNSDYSPIATFKYSSATGVKDVVVDADGLFVVEGNMLKVYAQLKDITVYDLTGVAVALFGNAEPGMRIALKLTSGIYIVKAIADDKTVSAKVSIK